MKYRITIRGHRFTYELMDEQTNESKTLAVDAPNDPRAVRKEIRRHIIEENWFLLEEYAKRRMRERFVISLGTVPEIHVFNFSSINLTRSHLDQIASALQRLYDHMRGKQHWRVRGIIIHPQDRINENSGELARGFAMRHSGIMVVYPHAFLPEAYRGTFSCSWLSGTVLHEAAHISVEAELLPIWEDHKKELGWRSLTNARIILPGGSYSCSYNVTPEACVTPYASLALNEDAVESVTAFAFNQGLLLHPLRRRLAATVLKKPKTRRGHAPKIQRYDPVLGPYPRYAFIIEKAPKSSFRSVRALKDRKPPKTVYYHIPDDLQLLTELYK